MATHRVCVALDIPPNRGESFWAWTPFRNLFLLPRGVEDSHPLTAPCPQKQTGDLDEAEKRGCSHRQPNRAAGTKLSPGSTEPQAPSWRPAASCCPKLPPGAPLLATTSALTWLLDNDPNGAVSGQTPSCQGALQREFCSWKLSSRH